MITESLQKLLLSARSVDIGMNECHPCPDVSSNNCVQWLCLKATLLSRNSVTRTFYLVVAHRLCLVCNPELVINKYFQTSVVFGKKVQPQVLRRILVAAGKHDRPASTGVNYTLSVSADEASALTRERCPL